MPETKLIELTTGVQDPSPFFLGEDVTHRLPLVLNGYDFDDIFLVHGRSLENLIAMPLAATLLDAGLSVTLIPLDEGERHKGWAALSELCERLVLAGATKRSIVLALGGGMVSNLVGLACALIYRGLRYVEIPTTLLNLTDGTLSNKQAINGNVGKNQFGTYYRPLFVWADVNTLRTEPIRQWRCGLTEAIKNGLIADRSWFEELRAVLTPDLANVRADLFNICLRIVESKHTILATDPSERGRAIILEYGHTVGHAVEFSCGDIPHGEAVGIGMCVAARIGAELGITDPAVLDAQIDIIGTRLGGPTAIPARCSPDEIVELIRTDNKRRSCEEVRFILLESVGIVHPADGRYETIVPDALLKQVLEDSVVRS